MYRIFINNAVELDDENNVVVQKDRISSVRIVIMESGRYQEKI